MKVKGQGFVEYALIAVLIAVVAIVLLAIIAPTINIGSHTVKGQIVKAYTMSCQTCLHGFATVRQQDDQDIVLEMLAKDYGLVNTGDYCTFSVNAMGFASDPHCTPATKR